MAAEIRFEIVCILGKRITVTEDYWQKIIQVKHPSMAGKDAQVQEALVNPDEIRESKSDPFVRLYYLRHESLHLCVVVKHLNGNGFIVTTYLTDRIKEGEMIWTK